MIQATRIILCTAALLLTAAAPAPEPVPSNQDILVLGNRNPDQVRQDYVKAMVLPSADDQLARFAMPVCPFVAGLPDSANAQIADRLRKVAAAAGIRVAPAKCSANALVFIVQDRAKLFETWRRSAPEIFGGEISDSELAAMTNSSQPVLSWQILDTRSSDGRQLGSARWVGHSGSGGGGAGQGGLSDSGATDTMLEVPFAAESRVRNQLSFEFGVSVVVIDRKAVAGADLRQVADFAAMQLFAHMDPANAAKQPAPTILSLLADAAAGRPSPLSLTTWDLAFLKSLYASTNTYSLGAQRGEIVKRMGKYMEQDQQR